MYLLIFQMDLRYNISMRIMSKPEQYAQQTLDELFAQSSLDPQTGERYWRGNLTDLIPSLNEKAHPGHVSKILQASGAITIVISGAGGRASEIKINRPLIFEDEQGNPVHVDVSSFTSTPTQQLRGEMHQLNKRVLILETQMGQVLQAIQHIQSQLFATSTMEAYGPTDPPNEIETSPHEELANEEEGWMRPTWTNNEQ